MIVIEKKIKLKKDAKGEPTKEVQYFVSLHPNHYDLPVTAKAWISVSVGSDCDIAFEEI